MGKRIDNNILDKQSYHLLPPTEQKKFEQFQKKRKQSKEEIEETELTSPMPTEPEPSNDQLSCDRAKLFEEKDAVKQRAEAKDDEP